MYTGYDCMTDNRQVWTGMHVLSSARGNSSQKPYAAASIQAMHKQLSEHPAHSVLHHA